MVHAMPGPVETAIARASDATGVDSAFLFGEAQRESRFDPKAAAGASSASGLFQFIDQTWLATLKRHGAKYGYARYAELISQTANGRYVAAGEARAAVMALRLDPRAASLMAGEMASDHAVWLGARLGRSPTAGELYAAHFLGREGAAQLCELAALTPGADAAQTFPAAALANPTLFRRSGRPVSLAELYAELTTPPPAYGGRAQSTPADPFLRYAAARQAERMGAHHAVYAIALARNHRPAQARGADHVGPAAAQTSQVAAATGEASGWVRPAM